MAQSSVSPSGVFNIADEFISRPARLNIRTSPPSLVSSVRLGYGELEFEVNRVANALLDSGCKPGDRVLIALPDSIEFIACFFGAAKIGAIAVPVNSMARAADYRHYVSNSGARFAVVQDMILDEFVAGQLASALELVVSLTGLRVPRLQSIGCQAVHWGDWLPFGR